MNHRHKLFIDLYTNPQSTETFLNATRSYSKAYPNASDPHKNASRLAGKEEIKKAIEGRMQELSDISLQDYIGMLNKEYLNAQNKDSVRIRALELLGKAKNFLNDSTTLNNTIVSLSQEDIKARIEAKRKALEPVNNSVDKLCIPNSSNINELDKA